MNDNPYSPPQSVVTDPGFSSAPDKYYVVSLRKLMILHVMTLGVYPMYWFYRHWKSIKDATGLAAWPVMRGIFSVFFTHSLFRTIDADIKARGESREWSPGSLATAYVVLAIAVNILDRMAEREIGSPFTDLLHHGLIPVIGLVLIQAQKAANQVSNDPQGSGNNRLTGANWVWIVLGGLLWAAVIFELISPS